MKQSHEERCRKYKQQIENLKLDKVNIIESCDILRAKIEKLEKTIQTLLKA